MSDTTSIIISFISFCTFRHQLESLDAQSPEAKKIQKKLDEFAKYKGLWDEFIDVTNITRSGDNGGHFHNRLIIEFESKFFQRHDEFYCIMFSLGYIFVCLNFVVCKRFIPPLMFVQIWNRVCHTFLVQTSRLQPV
jgi:hypothetical protein